MIWKGWNYKERDSLTDRLSVKYSIKNNRSYTGGIVRMSYPEIITLPNNPSLEGFAALQANITYCERDGKAYTLDLIRPWAGGF